MLQIIDASLSNLLTINNRNFDTKNRLDYFCSLEFTEFSRKQYMDTFKDISSSTANRDLRKGVELKLFKKIGEMNKTKYTITK